MAIDHSHSPIDKLRRHMKALGIEEEDITEKFIQGSGKGGQKINKTSSCVYLKHIPSGIEIKCQQTRSREANRLFAREELCQRLANIIASANQAKRQMKEKIKRQNRRPTQSQKTQMIEQKKHTTKKKSFRRKPSLDE